MNKEIKTVEELNIEIAALKQEVEGLKVQLKETEQSEHQYHKFWQDEADENKRLKSQIAAVKAVVTIL